MRLPDAAQTSRPWRIHELVGGFRLEDVWALPTPGGPGDFPRLVDLMVAFDPERAGPAPVRALFALRWRLGALLGLDDESSGLGARVPRLADRLPADLRAAAPRPVPPGFPFAPLYELGDEWAGEIANRTMHGVLHLGWVPDGAGGHRGQLAVYVRRNGLLGAAYMAAIAPFRHTIVYPQMLGRLGEEWRAREQTGRAHRDRAGFC